MYFRQILHDEKSCASYLIGCPSQGRCAVVDPQGDPQEYVWQVGKHGMAVSAVIETHLQADHVSTARELAATTGAPFCLGPGAEVDYDHSPLADDQVLEVGNRRIRVLHTPGHTPEHVCLVVDDWFLLTGDTLFVGDVGRIDLSLTEIDKATLEARARELHRSLKRLLAFPDWYEIYPGHYSGSVCGRGMDGKPISTLGWEKRHNRALQLSEDEFVRFSTEQLPPLPSDFHATKRHNLDNH